MITGLILHLLATIASAILGILPNVPVPSWLSGNSGPIATVFQDAGLMGAWFPVALVSAILLAVLAVWLLGFGIKFARIVVSVLSGGGGGAG